MRCAGTCHIEPAQHISHYRLTSCSVGLDCRRRSEAQAFNRLLCFLADRPPKIKAMLADNRVGSGNEVAIALGIETDPDTRTSAGCPFHARGRAARPSSRASRESRHRKRYRVFPLGNSCSPWSVASGLPHRGQRRCKWLIYNQIERYLEWPSRALPIGMRLAIFRVQYGSRMPGKPGWESKPTGLGTGEKRRTR